LRGQQKGKKYSGHATAYRIIHHDLKDKVLGEVIEDINIEKCFARNFDKYHDSLETAHFAHYSLQCGSPPISLFTVY
jgi:hypothetical protein